MNTVWQHWFRSNDGWPWRGYGRPRRVCYCPEKYAVDREVYATNRAWVFSVSKSGSGPPQLVCASSPNFYIMSLTISCLIRRQIKAGAFVWLWWFWILPWRNEMGPPTRNRLLWVYLFATFSFFLSIHFETSLFFFLWKTASFYNGRRTWVTSSPLVKSEWKVSLSSPNGGHFNLHNQKTWGNAREGSFMLAKSWGEREKGEEREGQREYVC